MLNMFSLKIHVEFFESIEPRLELGNEMQLLISGTCMSCQGEVHSSFNTHTKLCIIEKGLGTMVQGILVSHSGGIVTESLAWSLSQGVQFDMNNHSPFSRHEGILEVLKEVSEWQGFEVLIVNRDPIFPDVTLQCSHDFHCLFVISNLLVGDIISTPGHEVMEDLSAELTMM